MVLFAMPSVSPVECHRFHKRVSLECKGSIDCLSSVILVVPNLASTIVKLVINEFKSKRLNRPGLVNTPAGFTKLHPTPDHGVRTRKKFWALVGDTV
jgi:hypothetical protein